MSSKEKNIIKRARNLETEAIVKIYDRYSDPLFHYAVRRLGNSQQAEDFVAETFSKFLRALKNGGGPKDYIQAYLYRIIHNLITDYYRRKPLPLLELDEYLACEDLADPSIIMADQMKANKVRKTLQRLNPDHQQVIILKYLESFSNKEIARTMNKTEGAVRSQLHRALVSLRGILAEEENEL